MRVWQFQTNAQTQCFQMHSPDWSVMFSGGDDQDFLKEGVKTYLVTPILLFNLPTFFQPAHLESVLYPRRQRHLHGCRHYIDYSTSVPFKDQAHSKARLILRFTKPAAVKAFTILNKLQVFYCVTSLYSRPHTENGTSWRVSLNMLPNVVTFD